MKLHVFAVAVAALLAACGDDQPVSSAAPAESATLEQQAAVPEPVINTAAPVPAAVPAKKAAPQPLPSLPAAPIDLSVPQELIDELRLGEPFEVKNPEPLLPPLFLEKPKPQSKFQLNGRLLLNEQIKDDYAKSVDGAELQLQFKH